MKPNKLTPGHNLRWESSRMMLPEHKHLLQLHQKELNRKTKPVLDEQQIAVFSRLISEALSQEMHVKIKLFHPFKDRWIIGKVEKLVPERRQIKVTDQSGITWVKLDEIIDIGILEDHFD